MIPQPKDPAPPHLTFFPGDGTLHSTGPDYLRFIRAFLNGGELNGARIAKPETIEMMEIGAGVTAQLYRTISAYASAGYTTSVDSTRRDDITGRFGLRGSWQ